jgi:hypothetical protein
MDFVWIVFGIVVLIIFGAIIGIYYKKQKGEFVNYNAGDDNALDKMINIPD